MMPCVCVGASVAEMEYCSTHVWVPPWLRFNVVLRMYGCFRG